MTGRNEPDLSARELAALFGARASEVPQPRAAFLARIAEDAEAAARAARDAGQAVPRASGAVGVARLPLRARLARLLAGLGAPGGVVAAGLAGLWVGLSGPQALPDPALLWAQPDAFGALPGEVRLVLEDFESVEWVDG